MTRKETIKKKFIINPRKEHGDTCCDSNLTDVPYLHRIDFIAAKRKYGP